MTKIVVKLSLYVFFYVPGPDVELESSPGKQVYNERFLLHSLGCAGVGHFINVLPWPCTWKCILEKGIMSYTHWTP